MQSLRRIIRILQSIGGSGCSASPNTLSSRYFISLKLPACSASKSRPSLFQVAAIMPPFQGKGIAMEGYSVEKPSNSSGSPADPPACIKFRRLDKTAKHKMQIIDKEAVEEVKARRDIPDIRHGYIIQLKVEVPDNKRHVSVLKGIVIVRCNAVLNTRFRLRRLVAAVAVESLFPLYSPNMKEIKVLDKNKVRMAKLYYLREKMDALKKQW